MQSLAVYVDIPPPQSQSFTNPHSSFDHQSDSRITCPLVCVNHSPEGFLFFLRVSLGCAFCFLNFFAVCREVLDEVHDTSELDRIATRLQDQALGMAERVRKLVEENARVRREQEEYQREYEALVAEHEKRSQQIRDVEAQRKDKADRRRRIEVFLRMLEEQEECRRFESYTFVALVDKVVVRQDGKLDFCFRNGMNYTK